MPVLSGRWPGHASVLSKQIGAVLPTILVKSCLRNTDYGRFINQVFFRVFFLVRMTNMETNEPEGTDKTTENQADMAGLSGNPRPRLRTPIDSSEPQNEEVRATKLSRDDLNPSEFSQLHILRRVSLESIWGLLEHCPVSNLLPGDVLLEAGKSNQTMHMILSGRLSVHLDSQETEPIAFVECGETVGEISVIDDSPASAYVLAAESTRLLCVSEDTFWRLVEASHEFATNLLLLLAQRMRENNSTISEGTRQRRQLEHNATVDALTGLHNRRWLDEKLPRLVGRCRRGQEPMSVLMLDVDHFKRFNDDYGHAAGDQVLSQVSRTIMSKLRPTDLGARYGGEEFVIILPYTGMSGACIAAERLRSAVEETSVETSDGRILPPVTISLGVAQLMEDEEPMDLVGRADAALYRAKANGRNRVEY